MADDSIARRKFLLGAGMAGTAVAAGLAEPAPAQVQAPVAAPATPSASEPQPMLVLSATEAAFISAVADTMIPADALSPLGYDCGVVCLGDLAEDSGEALDVRRAVVGRHAHAEDQHV